MRESFNRLKQKQKRNFFTHHNLNFITLRGLQTNLVSVVHAHADTASVLEFEHLHLLLFASVRRGEGHFECSRFRCYEVGGFVLKTRKLFTV